MAAPFTDTAKIGVDLNSITTAAQLAAGQTGDARLGSQVFTSDGGIAVYVQAGGAIAANVTVAAVVTCCTAVLPVMVVTLTIFGAVISSSENY